MADQQTIHIKYIRSGIGFDIHTKQMIRSLGFQRLNQVVERKDSPQIRGLVARIPHFVEIVKAPVTPAWLSTPEYVIHPPEPKPEREVSRKKAEPHPAEERHEVVAKEEKVEHRAHKKEEAARAEKGKAKKAPKHAEHAESKHAAHAGKEKGKAAQAESPKKKAKADTKHHTHDKKGKK